MSDLSTIITILVNAAVAGTVGSLAGYITARAAAKSIMKSIFESISQDGFDKKIVEMLKNVIKRLSQDQDVKSSAEQLAIIFANAIYEQIKQKLPSAIDEASKKSPALQALLAFVGYRTTTIKSSTEQPSPPVKKKGEEGKK